jgi:hypothetical protein
MSRAFEEFPFEPGECDSCRWFLMDPKAQKSDHSGLRDVGTCTHPEGPLEPHTTRGRKSYPIRSMRTGLASSGMSCERYEEEAA